MFRLSRIELLIFASAFLSFAYFNQGGGWNQNARFAEVRAMVEEGRFAIDHFLVYQPDEATGGEELVRLPLDNAEYTVGDKRYRLSWVDMEWNLFPVGDKPLEPGVEKSAMVAVCSSGDIGFVPWTGHFHPNKPPGTSFLAVPGYWLIYHIERLLGISPDHWWVLDVNTWLASVLSVGLISAWACVLFFRSARNLSGAQTPALLATFALAFGSTFFPFATLLFDHNLTASLLIASFYFLRPGGTRKPSPRDYAASGLCAGLAAITNYVAAVTVVFMGLYALSQALTGQKRRACLLFALGVIPPFLLICWYGYTCFGSPFKLNTDFQNPLFKDEGNALGMFQMPSSYVAGLLLFSPFRGIFFFCPIFLLSVYGLGAWIAHRERRAEAMLCLAIFGFFFLVNASFNGYHAGFSAGPRYLVPGLPFLALPLVVAFPAFRLLSALFLSLSIGINLLLSATDAQNPVGVGGHARVEGHREEWNYNLLGDYALPLFISGKAWPLLDQQIQLQMEKERVRIASVTSDPAERLRQESQMKQELVNSINRSEASPFLLGSLSGPVSVNPIGAFEGLFSYEFFPPGSQQCRWASFNVGEFLTQESRWSLAPLLLLAAGSAALALRRARQADAMAIA